MNERVVEALKLVQQSDKLSEEEKKVIAQVLKDADKEVAVAAFKIERLEKVKRTTTVLLEQTIEELEAKRKSVEEQKRELEVEAALERVRSIAMGMRKATDMLDICQTIANELHVLGVQEVRNVQTAIFYEEKGTYMNYEFYVKHDKSLITEVDYRLHPAQYEFAFKMLQGPDEFFALSLEGEKLKSWYEYQKTTPQFVDTFLETAPSLNYYWYSMGPVALGLSTYAPLSEEQIALYKRFRNVFGLSYRRYLDIERAEAQAREAKIEAALEKVRSRSLAMHKSDELPPIARTMFDQLRGLGLELEDGLILMVFKEGSNDQLQWPVVDGLESDKMFLIPELDNPIVKRVYEARANGVKFIEEHFDKAVKDAFLDKVFSVSDYKDIPIEFHKQNYAGRCYHYSFAMEKYTGVLLQSFNRDSYPPEHNEILRRFARVFEQAYVRFLDLQKAEAQARESQIQLALERVRARTMAMHNSAELGEVAVLLFEQVKTLGIETYASGFNIWNEEQDKVVSWMSNPTGSINPPFEMPIQTYEQHRRIFEAWKSKEAFLEDDIIGEDLVKHYRFLRSFPLLDEAFSKSEAAGIETPARQVHNVAFFSKGYLLFITAEPQPGFREIFVRFAKVFEQTYTRFLDLTKAEAQAREAKIEAALERVRSRAMAMQNSSHLNRLISHVFDECTKLDIILDRALIMIVDPKTLNTTWVLSNPEVPEEPSNHVVQFHKHGPYLNYIDAWKKRLNKWHYVLEGREKREWDQFIFNETELSKLPAPAKEGMQALSSIQLNASFADFGSITLSSFQPLTESQYDILIRFTKVFDLTYTRFNDLKQAEAQAREARIEAALEKVRSRSLAMHKSDEMSSIAKMIFEQMRSLALEVEDGLIISLLKEGTHDQLHWPVSEDAEFDTISLPHFDDPIMNETYKARETGVKFIERHFDKKTKDAFLDKVFSITGYSVIPVELRNRYYAGSSYHYSYAMEKHTGVLMHSYNREDNYPAEHNDILRRFARVFEQAYVRFLDLQKAEKQTRESQIQLALERVRARTMAMQHSAELSDTAQILFQQFKQLGEDPIQITIGIFNEEQRLIEFRITGANGSGEKIEESFNASIDEPTLINKMFTAWKQSKKSEVITLEGQELLDWIEYRNSMSGKYAYQTKVEPGDRRHVAVGFFSKGLLSISTKEILSDETMQILERFASVFDLTYTRFLDLKQAEKQAREAQIESALEKVRSRSLAMHNSGELEQVVTALFERLVELGLTIDGALIFLFDKETKDIQLWIATNKLPAPVRIDIPYDPEIENNVILKDLWYAVESGEHIFNRSYSGKAKDDYFKYVMKCNDSKIPEALLQLQVEAKAYTACFASEKNSLVGVDSWSGSVTEAEDFQILVRFARVFEQAYIRFLDLKTAEAQAREAQIEAALEKIRSSSLAMHHSSQINEVATVLYEKLKELGLEFDGGAAIVLFPENTKDMTIGVISPLTPPTFHRLPYDEDAMADNFILQDLLHQRIENADLINKCYSFDQKNRYFEYVFKHNEPIFPESVRETILKARSYTATFIAGQVSLLGVNSWTEQLLSEENIAVLRRLARVFEQAYIRFLDLQKAEAQAKEAQIEAALEKVRSRTLAMQHSHELAETAAVLFQQLIHLGIEPNRLYIGVVEDQTNNIEFWITDEDGSKVSTMFKGDAGKNVSLKKMIDAWEEGRKSIVIDMHGKELEEYFHYLGEELLVPFKGGLAQKRRLQYIAFFSKGFIGMASPEEQRGEVLQLLERFAYVFNLTFTRFNDLKVAEAHALQAEQDLIQIKEARRRAEDALAELKATQTQLIQSEKMASLGELTAGIAHEIQNPLNFVNNFSEVSGELLEEIKLELDRGDVNEAKAIVEDVKQNLQKIAHHGKRADGIVKSMLQHSRKGSGQKDLVDINSLVDEYLRMSYHGFRAKDKSFNAILETYYDPEVKIASIVGQDIGRVLLNLFNNAFYAVNERKKAEQNGFEPMVQVTTARLNGAIEIKVKDNGTGIPEKVLEKIYQPFFTTKPTGEGTGLGLSLSYDIITKGHGGEMKVATKESEGTEFIIKLPNSSAS